SSEQAIRMSTIFRKVTNGFRSDWGKDLFASVRSVVNTGQRQGFSAFQSIKIALSPLKSFFFLISGGVSNYHNFYGSPMMLAEVEVMGRTIQLDRTAQSNSVAYNTTYSIKNQYSTANDRGYLRACWPYESSQYDTYTDACTHGNTHCISTSLPSDNPYGNTYWQLKPVSAEASGAVHCGDLVYLVNRRNEPFKSTPTVTESYLDINGSGCHGNKYCASATTNFNRAKGGTGI
ncbi:hypothetical protein QUF74_15300, partial [Candidatus Halobeggiatoa sp. HSG11]|nr:hypothetical protein [Candidatus Halobeggiatoa sp. HSG11]